MKPGLNLIKVNKVRVSIELKTFRKRNIQNFNWPKNHLVPESRAVSCDGPFRIFSYSRYIDEDLN